MRLRPAGLLLSLASTSFVACSDATDIAPCSGDVTVSIVRFDPPKLSWEPDCGVDILTVEDAATLTMWMISSRGTHNSLTPPVTYGVVPDEALQEFEPQEFKHGNGYVVRVFRYHREADGTQLMLPAGKGNFRW
jgi:hypothetical protein